MPDGNILVIDDEPGMREGTRRILQRDDYDCDTASTGKEALERIKEKTYGIYLVDLKLPDFDGLELVSRFIQNDPDAVCIVATAYANLETALEAARHGAYDFLAKPFTPQMLRQAVKRGLERRDLLLQARELRKEREERLLELATERSRTRTILNTLRDGVIVINNNRELALMNPTAQSLLGITEMKISKDFIEQLPESELREKIAEILEKDDEGKMLRMREIPGISEGQMLSIYTAPIPGQNSQEAGRTLVIRDITHWAELDRAKSNFVRVVAHEVKAPIGAVVGFIDLILKGYVEDPEKKLDYLKRSKKRLKGLLTMVLDLLAITRQESPTSYMNFEKVDIASIIDEVVGSLESSAKEKDVDVKMELSDTPQIWADETAMVQLFTNLVSNGIKYNRDGGDLIIESKVVGSGVEISVTDNGIGMKKDKLQRIWEPFFRVSDKNTKKISGTGLGLSIVRRIVDNHRGRIDVDSVVEEGTTFTVWLPIESQED
ncbi:MAG: ATP-binding protein [Candidatus Zixiibacteriota bacterium]